MRFLADAGISPKTIDFPRTGTTMKRFMSANLGYSALWTGFLVEMARAEDRVLLTFNLDFGGILALGVIARPSVLIFTLSDERSDSANRRLEGVLSEQTEALASGVLILVEDARYRIRRLPIR